MTNDAKGWVKSPKVLGSSLRSSSGFHTMKVLPSLLQETMWFVLGSDTISCVWLSSARGVGLRVQVRRDILPLARISRGSREFGRDQIWGEREGAHVKKAGTGLMVANA